MATIRSSSQPSPRGDARRRAWLGIGSAVISLFLAPPAFGLVGTMLGISATRRGAGRLGWAAIVLSVAFALFSTWLALQLVHRL